MIDSVISSLNSATPLLICSIVFGIAFIENIFPPSPSDLLIVFAGSLVGLDRIGFIPLLLSATAGSTLGFVVMYKIGDWFGDKILEKGKIKFIPVESVYKVEMWFRKYGYWIIIANRFLAGTRAVVSFFAGLSELPLFRTTVLSFISALLWSSILISAGSVMGNNWESILYYLQTYSQIITGIIVIVILLLAIRFLSTRNGNSREES